MNKDKCVFLIIEYIFFKEYLPTCIYFLYSDFMYMWYEVKYSLLVLMYFIKYLYLYSWTFPMRYSLLVLVLIHILILVLVLISLSRYSPQPWNTANCLSYLVNSNKQTRAGLASRPSVNTLLVKAKPFGGLSSASMLATCYDTALSDTSN